MASAVEEVPGTAEASGAGGAEVEGIVSNNAWIRFPALRVSLQRWAEECGAAERDILVTAMPIGMDWVSVRVSRLEETLSEPEDWIEWLAPMSYRSAEQGALDHFAWREMREAVSKLRGRTGNLLGGFVPTRPDRGGDVIAIEIGEGGSMPKTNVAGNGQANGATNGARPQKARGAAQAAPEPAEEAPAKRKPGRPARAAAGAPATTRATAPAMETRSAAPAAPGKASGRKPGPKPKGKGAGARRK